MAIFQHHTKKGYAKNRKIWRFHVARNWRQCHFARISCPFTIVQKNDILQDKWINLKILCNLCGVVLNPASASFTFLWPIASLKLKQLKQHFSQISLFSFSLTIFLRYCFFPYLHEILHWCNWFICPYSLYISADSF